MKEFAIILLIRVPRMAPPATKQDRLTMSALWKNMRMELPTP